MTIPFYENIGTIIVLVITAILTAIIIVPNGRNWRNIPLRLSAAVKQFGQVTGSRGSGPLFLWPWQDIDVFKMYSQVWENVGLPAMKTKQVLDGDGNIVIPSLALTVVTRGAWQVTDAVLRAIAMPGSNVEQKAMSFIVAAAAQAIGTMTYKEAMNAEGKSEIEQRVLTEVSNEPLLQKWGLKLSSFDVMDIVLPAEVEAANNEYVTVEADVYRIEQTAEAERQAKILAAKAEVEAFNTEFQGEGPDNYWKHQELDTLQAMAEKGAFQTYAHVGTGNILEMLGNQQVKTPDPVPPANFVDQLKDAMKDVFGQWYPKGGSPDNPGAITVSQKSTTKKSKKNKRGDK